MAQYVANLPGFQSRLSMLAMALVGKSLMVIAIIGWAQSSSGQQPPGNGTPPNDAPKKSLAATDKSDIDESKDSLVVALVKSGWKAGNPDYDAYVEINPNKQYAQVIYEDADGKTALKDETGKTVVINISGEKLRTLIAFKAMCDSDNAGKLPPEAVKVLNTHLYKNEAGPQTYNQDHQPITVFCGLTRSECEKDFGIIIQGCDDAGELKENQRSLKTREQVKAILRAGKQSSSCVPSLRDRIEGISQV